MLVSSRMPTPGLMLVLLLLGCLACTPATEESRDGRSPATTSEPTTEPTPLADYDASDLVVVRDRFCDRVSDQAVAAALSREPDEATSWRPGGRLPGTKDISNEFGCAWDAGPLSARAWVFAPPTTPGQASHFVREVVDSGCHRVAGAPALGAPSVAQQCGGHTPRTAISGLVGDAWVGARSVGSTVPAAMTSIASVSGASACLRLCAATDRAGCGPRGDG